MIELDSNEKLVAQFIYRNMTTKEMMASDLEKADMSLCKEELMSVLGDRPAMPSAVNMCRVIRFISKCGFDYIQMYISKKVQANAGTSYVVSRLDSDASFVVNIEEEWILSTNDEDRVVSHVGIILDMD